MHFPLLARTLCFLLAKKPVRVIELKQLAGIEALHHEESAQQKTPVLQGHGNTNPHTPLHAIVRETQGGDPFASLPASSKVLVNIVALISEVNQPESFPP